MNNKLVFSTLALAAAASASAQSSVTIFGIVDASVEHVSNSGGPSATKMVQGGLSRSRLGFRGVEDLGGGLSASFWLEGDLNVDDGAGTASNSNNQSTGVGTTSGFNFNARSTVSLGGNWGELRLGRDFTPQFWNLTIFDPFSTRGVGTNLMNSGVNTLPNSFTTTRVSNSVGYFLPADLGGIYGQLQYFTGENGSATPNRDDGTGGGGRIGYMRGLVNIAAAYQSTKYVAGNFHQRSIAGAYQLRNVLLEGQVSRDRSGAVQGRGLLLGGVASFGVSDVRIAYSRYHVTTAAGANPTASKLAVGYVYNLSRRTGLYATLARLRNTNGATMSLASGFGAPAANHNSTGFDLGLKTAF